MSGAIDPYTFGRYIDATNITLIDGPSQDPQPGVPVFWMTSAAFTAWMLSLPTVKPYAANVPWNNGGTPNLSDGL